MAAPLCSSSVCPAGIDAVSRSALYSIDLEDERNSRNEFNAIRALAPLFFYFVSAGIVTVMLGPLLPTLIQHWQIRDAQAGTLFLVNFMGQLCGSWFAARNLKASVLYGAALTGAACCALAWLDFKTAHVAFFAIGLGLGAGLTAGNVIAGTIIPATRARLITMLNVAWGIGAIACPLLVRWTGTGGLQRFLYIAAALLAASSLFATAIPSSACSARMPKTRVPVLREPGLTNRSLPLPRVPLLVFCAAMFLYIGVENSLGGWLPSYAIRIHPLVSAASVSLLFWTGELAGRLLIVGLIGIITETALYRVCLAFLISTELLLCMLPQPSANGVMVLTILAALSLAPVYPLILSFLLARTGNHARLGVFFVSASCGGAILPWLTGVFSTRFHGLRTGLIVPAVGICLLVAISSNITAKSPAPVEVLS
jgi:FHS family glucose/mannose:H+ symporter-like MFS transporter